MAEDSKGEQKMEPEDTYKRIDIDFKNKNVRTMLNLIINSNHEILNLDNVLFEIELLNSYKGPLLPMKYEDEDVLRMSNLLFKSNRNVRYMYVSSYLCEIRNIIKNNGKHFNFIEEQFICALQSMRCKLIYQDIIVNSMKNVDDMKITILVELVRNTNPDEKEESSIQSYLYKNRLFDPYLMKEIFSLSNYPYPEILAITYCPRELKISEIKHEEIMSITHGMYLSTKDTILKDKHIKDKKATNSARIYHVSYIGKIFHFYLGTLSKKATYLTESSMNIKDMYNIPDKFSYRKSSSDILEYLEMYVFLISSTVSSSWSSLRA